MKILKNIIRSLLVIILFIGSINVYGYGLIYEASFKNPTNNSDNSISILGMAQASSGSKEEYEIRKGEGAGNDGWISPSQADRANTGSDSSFAAYYYAFHYEDYNKVYTTYNSGFVSSGRNNNVFYDVAPSPITISSNTFAGFTGVPVNIPRDQGTTVNGSIIIQKSNTDYNNHVKWKVTQEGVRVDINELTNKTVMELVGKYGKNEEEAKVILTKGIRFSNGLRSTDIDLGSVRSNMDTAWKYFQATIGKWYAGGRGFQEYNEGWMPTSTGTYKRGASVANEFDNILKIPFDKKTASARKIYINHVDEKGNKIDGLRKGSQQLVIDGNISDISSSGATYGYQESYGISSNNYLRVTENSNLNVGDKKYEFLYGNHAKSDVLANDIAGAVSRATSLLRNSYQKWNTPYSFACPSAPDVVVVNLVYKEIPPPPVKPVLPDLQLVGRLQFINKNGTEYSAATTGPNIDYAPSTGELTPYASGAYPYVVRAIKYSKQETIGTAYASSTAYITYRWQYWKFEHRSTAQTCTTSPGSNGKPGTTTCVHKCTGACRYYSYESSSTKSRTFNYAVPYKHTYYRIDNFKMYRISRLEVYDNENNTGGTLFDGGMYTVLPSSTYNQRFNNSRGKINRTLSINFPSGSYWLPEVYSSAASPGSGQSSASAKADAKLNAQTHLSASNAINLTISYAYDNDYIELDGMTNMLRQNYKSWSERITLANNTTRDLDSTREGPGKYNGSAIQYNGNLMSYMKPSSKLTTETDFIPNYQKIPSFRENGIRNLQAKIYYEKVTDGKYNVGSDAFESTDATYRLNNRVNVSQHDYAPQNKLYKDNDVNKVDVLTPISFGNFQLITDEKVDHSSGAGNSTILQKNAEFRITPTTSGSNIAGYSYGDTRKFVKGYYFMFDFNVIYNGREVEAFTPIYLAGASSTLYAKTTDSFSSGSADQITNSVKIVAVSTNITEALQNYFSRSTYSNYTYMDSGNNKQNTSNSQNQRGLLTRNDIVADANHAMYKIITTKNIGRIFDFAVTDCSDISFKDAFRKDTTGNVNESKQQSYYSGYKKWDLYSSEYNEMAPRTDIGSSPQTILPLGPYKHTKSTYINAPKMGYRISFDLKTTGYMGGNNFNNTRRVEITPSYYYISKDGKTFDNNIRLYYKNSSEKYVDFSTSGYTIYYKPNDGYRYLRNSMYTDDYTSMSSKLEPLTISSKMIFTNKMMATNNTSFIQSWYGEFKLPNSTIAISKNAGSPNGNVNNPYKDGYIGVIFDIKCIDNNGFTLSYNTSDKSASSVNTSQWDYEGFMNFKSPGSSVVGSLKYQLEKDMWNIDNALYQKVKGTVVLFDTDNRAASDFE